MGNAAGGRQLRAEMKLRREEHESHKEDGYP